MAHKDKRLSAPSLPLLLQVASRPRLLLVCMHLSCGGGEELVVKIGEERQIWKGIF